METQDWKNLALTGAVVGAVASIFVGKKKATLGHAAKFGAYGAGAGLLWSVVGGKVTGVGKHLVGHGSGREHMPYGFPADFTGANANLPYGFPADFTGGYGMDPVGAFRAGVQSGPAIVGVQSGPAIVGAASYEGGGLVAEYPGVPQMVQPQVQVEQQPVIEEVVVPEYEGWGERPWHHHHRHHWDRWHHGRRW